MSDFDPIQAPRPELQARTVGVGRTGDARIDALLSGSAWERAGSGPTTITYSFADDDSRWAAGDLQRTGIVDVGRTRFELSAEDQAAFRAALATWANVANLRFVEVEDTGQQQGDIRVSGYLGNFLLNTAFTVGTSGRAIYGDIWFDNFTLGGIGRFPSSTYSFSTMVHEIGHALGLKHPHESEDGFPALNPAEDWFGTTVMSYRDFPSDPDLSFAASLVQAETPMALDVAAIQHLYGAGPGNPGNTAYRWSEFPPLAAIWDRGGVDRIDVTDSLADARIDLRAGTWSRVSDPYVLGSFRFDGNVLILAGSIIENANGNDGDDRITGNEVANVLRGQDGDDRLLGLAGDDQLFGGAGNDLLEGGSGADRALGAAGADRLLGGPGADDLRGGLDADVVDGGSGADRIAGGPGDDTLRAGAGNDTILGGSGFDTLIVPGERGGYELDLDGDGAGTLRDLEPEPVGTGTDAFSGIERIRFLDETIDLAVS